MKTSTGEKLAAGGILGGGCLFICVWLFGILLSLATSVGVLAALICGVYWLATGQFLLDGWVN